ncbi:MAG: hypothetical protein M0Z65_10255 [Firmicutes bacterium]|uniref:Uncharacterized protein n=1 Tax=Melghirimyces thermohalophilus TaxID=1236220 RepID=A0A1G6LV06_9BACL|nr:hypothetical protein [Melghirimyces thermohalophilus]MDA8353544.1 hypothetical protein [Bacillota bacterium]SDC46927.1 hypothetical protein SAMN04488112_108134 [Melghirimyces thermohalophilus]
MPALLVQIALVVILVRAAYTVVRHFQTSSPDWFEAAFQVSIGIVSLWLLLDYF